MSRQCYLPAIKEVFALLQVNTHNRFLTGKHAERANELILWCENYHELNEREQNAVLAHFRYS